MVVSVYTLHSTLSATVVVQFVGNRWELVVEVVSEYITISYNRYNAKSYEYDNFIVFYFYHEI